MENLVKEARAAYKKKFGRGKIIFVKAPGRVNLIGEHTDYNDGFVFPVAIDRYALICGEKNNNGRLRLYSVMYEEKKEYPVEVSVATLFEAPSVRVLSQVIRSRQQEEPGLKRSASRGESRKEARRSQRRPV